MFVVPPVLAADMPEEPDYTGAFVALSPDGRRVAGSPLGCDRVVVTAVERVDVVEHALPVSRCTTPMGVDADRLLVAGTQGLVLWDLRGPTVRLGGDIVATVELGDEVAAVATRAARAQWHVLSPEVAPDIAFLSRQDFDFTVTATGGDRWLLRVWSDTLPESQRVYDRRIHELFAVGPAAPAWSGYPWRPREALTVSAADGLELPVYLTLPDPARFRGPPWPGVLRLGQRRVRRAVPGGVARAVGSGDADRPLRRARRGRGARSWGHGPADDRQSAALQALVDDFLARCLGGEAPDLGPLDGSGLEVRGPRPRF